MTTKLSFDDTVARDSFRGTMRSDRRGARHAAEHSALRSDGTYPLIATFARHIHTRVASSTHELEAAAELVRRRYKWRGYAPRTRPNSEAGELTIVTTERDTPAGTLTVRPDGPHGLEADSGFRRELDALRSFGHTLGEVTRLALEAEAESKAVLASLFYACHWVTHHHFAATMLVVEVNPRHAPFYRRILGFKVASGQRLCERVGAPGVLLQAPIEVIGERTAAFRDRVLAHVLALNPMLRGALTA
jgi:hypothetical protein